MEMHCLSIKYMKVNYIGTQYIHKFINPEMEVVYVTCSNEDFEKITEKPSLKGYEYQYTVSGMSEVDTESKLLGDGEYYELDGQTITKNWEDNGEVKFEYK